MDILSHDSDVALSDQEEIIELHRNLEHLSENDSVREERTPEKRDLQSFPEDGLGYNGTGKSLVLYKTFRVKTQDGSKLYDSLQLRERIKRLRQKAQFQFESQMPPFKRAQDMNIHLRVAKRMSRKARRMQAMMPGPGWGLLCYSAHSLWGSNCLMCRPPPTPACSSVAQTFGTRSSSLKNRVPGRDILKK